jgi:steroid 5-alpha reductase family enzyme
MRELERNVRKRAALRPQPSTITNSHCARAIVHLGFFSWSRQYHRAWLQWLLSTQLAHVALDRLIATAEPVLGYQVLPDCSGITAAA